MIPWHLLLLINCQDSRGRRLQVYYSHLTDDKQESIRNDTEQGANFLKGIQQMEQHYKNPPKLTEMPGVINNNPAQPQPVQVPDSGQ